MKQKKLNLFFKIRNVSLDNFESRTNLQPSDKEGLYWEDSRNYPILLFDVPDDIEDMEHNTLDDEYKVILSNPCIREVEYKLSKFDKESIEMLKKFKGFDIEKEWKSLRREFDLKFRVFAGYSKLYPTQLGSAKFILLSNQRCVESRDARLIQFTKVDKGSDARYLNNVFHYSAKHTADYFDTIIFPEIDRLLPSTLSELAEIMSEYGMPIKPRYKTQLGYDE
jgi:hypothetical protein